MFDQVLLLVLTALGGSLGSYLLYYRPNMRRAQAVARGAEMENVERAVRIWRELAQGLESEVKALRDELNELKQQVCKNIDCQERKVA